MRGIRRRSRFPLVGRDVELKYCSELLHGGVGALYVYGEHGLGKSRLLAECARLAETAQMPVTRVDARRIGRSPHEVLEALELPRGVDPDLPSLLVIDNFEAHASLELVYRDEVLPQLPPQRRLIFAGSGPLTLPWGTRSQRRLLHVPLKRLSEIDSEAYLSAIGVPEEARHTVANRSRGKPLLLATMAEFAATEGHAPDTNSEPYKVSEVLKHLLTEAPSNEHRQSLWIISMSQVLSERTLAAVLDQPRSNECYRWLSSRPYVEKVPGGLVIHPLLREGLLKDLRDTSPELHREFMLRSGRFLISRLEGLRDAQRRQSAMYTHFYAQRLQTPISTLWQLLQESSYYQDRGKAADSEALARMVHQHEGERSAAICAYWFERKPEQTDVLRTMDGKAEALLLPLTMSEMTIEEERYDPAVAAAFAVLQARAASNHERPSRRSRRYRRLGRNVTLIRYWLANRTYQSRSPAQAELVSQIVLQSLASAELNLLFIVVPDRRQPQIERLIENGLLKSFADSQFELDGQGYHLIGVDFAETSPGAWLRNALTKTISGGRALLNRPLESWRMSRVDFSHAVQAALEHFTDSQQLRVSPLAHTVPLQGPTEYGLRHWLMEGINRLARMPGGAIYARQLQRYYIPNTGLELPTEEHQQDMDQLLAAQQLLTATLWDALMQQQRVRQQAV